MRTKEISKYALRKVCLVDMLWAPETIVSWLHVLQAERAITFTDFFTLLPSPSTSVTLMDSHNKPGR